jgi:hypothetical protein
MDVVKAIEKTRTADDNPITPVKMVSMKVV